MCDNESERTDWFKSIREAQSSASKIGSGGSSSVIKGEFQLLVEELEDTPADTATSGALLGMFQRFHKLFGKASSRYVSHPRM